MKNMPKSVSLIISTYNWVDALELCLDSVVKQTRLPDEVIIADDGSTKETKQLLDKYFSKLNIIHVWHEDKGFRLSEIRNKAIAKSSSEFIIQIDGDIILNKYFIIDHINKSKPNFFTVGSRVLLNDKLSKKIIKHNKTYFDVFSRGIINQFNTIRLPIISKFLNKPTRNIEKVIESARGCNMSFWRQDLIDVNGYDQDMTGWGREDSEISVRLINSGKTKKKIKLAAIQYHIYHKESNRKGLNKNDKILENTIVTRKIKCNNGIENINDVNTPEKLKITAIIPTFNEEKKVEKALMSVGFADEIIVVDSFSTDDTLKIAEKYATKIIQHEYVNSATQKNWIIPQAKNEWIFLLDADEWLTPELRNEVIELYHKGFDQDAYWIYRNNYFMGKRVKYSGWQGDKVIRLFKKDCRYQDIHVHAEIISKGKNVTFLKNKINHNTYTTIDNYIKKLNRYAYWQAEDYDKSVGIIMPHHLFIKPFFRFVIHYIIKRGFLDGVPGLTISILQAYAVGMRYIKLWLFRRGMK